MKILTALFDRTAAPPGYERMQDNARRITHNASDFATLQVLAADYDGYVREAAVARCLALGRPELLPIVIARLNDWVAEVRRTARTAVMTLLPFMPDDALIAALPSILRLRAARRADHEAWVREFEQAMSRQVDVASLLAAARSADLPVARACFQLLRAFALADPAVLIQIALERKGDIVLAREALFMCAGLPDADRIAHYQLALASHFGAVRALAVRALLQDDAIADRRALAIGVLMDDQPAVRTAAIWFAGQAGYDVGGHYRALIESGASGSALRIALASLASCGCAGDADLLRDWTGDPSPTVRTVAYAGWLRLAPADKDQIAALALHDRSPRVRRFAVQAVQRNKAFVPAAVLRSVWVDTRDFNVLPLLWTGNLWEWVATVAALAVDDMPVLLARPHAADDLARRIMSPDGRYVPPSTLQWRYLSSAPVTEALGTLLRDHPRALRELQVELGQHGAGTGLSATRD